MRTKRRWWHPIAIGVIALVTGFVAVLGGVSLLELSYEYFGAAGAAAFIFGLVCAACAMFGHLYEEAKEDLGNKSSKDEEV